VIKKFNHVGIAVKDLMVILENLKIRQLIDKGRREQSTSQMIV